MVVQNDVWQGLLGSVIADAFVAHWKRNSVFALSFVILCLVYSSNVNVKQIDLDVSLSKILISYTNFTT